MLELREEHASDAAFAFRVYAESRLEEVTAWGWPPDQLESFLHMQFHARERSCKLNNPDAAVRIVMYEGRPVGRIVSSSASSGIRLIDIALIQPYRNRGIGTKLVRDMQRQAAGGGIGIRLHVLTGSPACSWYERLGFLRIADQPPYAEMEWQPDPLLSKP